jgi:hypothetical protein
MLTNLFVVHSAALVAQPGRPMMMMMMTIINEKSLGRDSSPRPLPFCWSLGLIHYPPTPYQGNDCDSGVIISSKFIVHITQ